jgi:uncharacterized protein YcnI
MPQFQMSHSFARVGAATVGAAVLTLSSGTLAWAHVQVIPETTAVGSEITKLTFRVPNESDTAGTTALSISLPTKTPFAEVLAEPVEGWTVTVTEAKLPEPVTLDGTKLTEAPSTVTWTATKGHQVGPGQFQEFAVSAGPIPEGAKELSFPATQTYSDGTVVKWNQPQPAGADEPEHPVPSFTVTAAVVEGATPAESAAASPAAALPQANDAVAEVDSSDGTARALAAGGLVAGGLGLLLGLFA